jgi:hypothetical protein
MDPMTPYDDPYNKNLSITGENYWTTHVMMTLSFMTIFLGIASRARGITERSLGQSNNQVTTS